MKNLIKTSVVVAAFFSMTATAYADWACYNEQTQTIFKAKEKLPAWRQAWSNCSAYDGLADLRECRRTIVCQQTF